MQGIQPVWQAVEAGSDVEVLIVAPDLLLHRGAQAMVAEAETALQRTELLLAEANVDRQRRLIALGAGSKSQLQRAESALSLLKRSGQ